MSWAALILNDTVITWPAVFAALGAVCAMLGCLALYMARGHNPRELAAVLPAAVLLALVLGRLVHWYCHPLQYSGFLSAMTDFFQGGFSLSGVFAGVLLTALLAAGAGVVTHLPDLLDALAPAGALGIAVGRMGSLFDLSDRGRFIIQDEAFRRLPFGVFTTFAEGAGEWRFATFAFQGLAAALLALALTWVHLALTRRMLRQGEEAQGRVFALFLALYGAGQIVLDSTRYDADFFRFNGFVHMPQILCGAALAGAIVWLSVRSVRQNRLRWYHWTCWALTLFGMGLGGYMEYYVQRRAGEYILGYGVMSAALALAAAAAVVLCLSQRPGFGKKRKTGAPAETAAQA